MENRYKSGALFIVIGLLQLVISVIFWHVGLNGPSVVVAIIAALEIAVGVAVMRRYGGKADHERIEVIDLETDDCYFID